MGAALVWVVVCFAQGFAFLGTTDTSDTADTGQDTGTVTPTGTTEFTTFFGDTGDTAPFVNGTTAGDLASEDGGSPFADGCAHGGLSASFAVALAATLLTVGRTRRTP